MITAAKLAVFHKHGGNIDLWQRRGCPESDVFPEREWAELERFLQELSMYKHNLVSERYANDIRRRLADLSADENVRDQLMDLV